MAGPGRPRKSYTEDQGITVVGQRQKKADPNTNLKGNMFNEYS